MGAFFTNFQVHTDSPEDVAACMKVLADKRAYVSDAKNGWVTVYEELADSQNPERIQEVAGELSTALRTPVLAFLVHDSDVLLYWLYEQGEMSDHYNSRPDYFSDGKDPVASTVWKYLEGNATLLKRYSVSGTRLPELKKILHREPMSAEDYLKAAQRKKKRRYDFEEQRLRALAYVLGIDENRACLGFHDVASGGAGNRKQLRLVKKATGKRGPV